MKDSMGQIIRRLRKERNLTQEELAEQYLEQGTKEETNCASEGQAIFRQELEVAEALHTNPTIGCI